MYKLKPCPFCGGEAEFTQDNEPWYAVNCKNCWVHTGNRNQDYKAINVWNTRAADKTIAQLVEALEGAVSALSNAEFIYMKYAPNDSWKAGWTKQKESAKAALAAVKEVNNAEK